MLMRPQVSGARGQNGQFPAQAWRKATESHRKGCCKRPKLYSAMNLRGNLIIRPKACASYSLQEMSRKNNVTVVIKLTPALVPIADRVIRLHDAKVRSIEVNENPSDSRDDRILDEVGSV